MNETSRDRHDEPARSVPRRRGRAVMQVVLAALLLIAGFAGYRAIMALAPEPKVRPKVEAPLPVRVLPVRLRDVRPRWTFYGQAAALREARLQLPVSGRVAWTSPSWRDGARVRAGEALLRIDELPWKAAVEEARAALREARAQRDEAALKVESERRLLARAAAQLEIARRELERIEALVARGTLPGARLDQQRRAHLQAEEKLEQRRHALAAARARLARQETALKRLQWALRRAEDNLANTTLRAPFSGRLHAVRAQLGQQARPGVVLAELVSDAPPEIRFMVPESRLLRLRRAGEDVVGRKARVIWRDGGRTVEMDARVVRMAARVESQRGEVVLHAAVEEPRRAAWLLPGAFVEVRMRGPLHRQVALLPESALQQPRTVFVVDEGKLRRRTIEILGMQGNRVIAAGLRGGERVVRHRLSAPRAGRRVRVLDDADG